MLTKPVTICALQAFLATLPDEAVQDVDLAALQESTLAQPITFAEVRRPACPGLNWLTDCSIKHELLADAHQLSPAILRMLRPKSPCSTPIHRMPYADSQAHLHTRPEARADPCAHN